MLMTSFSTDYNFPYVSCPVKTIYSKFGEIGLSVPLQVEKILLLLKLDELFKNPLGLAEK